MRMRRSGGRSAFGAIALRPVLRSGVLHNPARPMSAASDGGPPYRTLANTLKANRSTGIIQRILTSSRDHIGSHPQATTAGRQKCTLRVQTEAKARMRDLARMVAARAGGIHRRPAAPGITRKTSDETSPIIVSRLYWRDRPCLTANRPARRGYALRVHHDSTALDQRAAAGGRFGLCDGGTAKRSRRSLQGRPATVPGAAGANFT